MGSAKLNLSGPKSLDLSYQVDEFKNLCTKWDKFDDKLNALSVQHVSRYTAHPQFARRGC